MESPAIVFIHDFSTVFLREATEKITTPYVLFSLNGGHFQWEPFGLERMMDVAAETGACWVYSNYYDQTGPRKEKHPVLEYQEGSLRDDFSFGPLILVRTRLLQKVIKTLPDYTYAAFYALRLAASLESAPLKIDEYLYSDQQHDFRSSGERQFDYVHPDRRQVQLEMEKVCTAHLKQIHALLSPPSSEVSFAEDSFKMEASVVIPVLNRIETLPDALDSALSQKTDFPFNVIVVDNHSEDGTSALIEQYVQKDSRVIHIIPSSQNLGIGGCWNEAVFHPECGHFVVQLDSDDLYSGTDTLQRIVDRFYEDKAAMVIGSYRMVDKHLQEIPPGIIDHREWTDENGKNNALRIHGLGAPRAFYTPLLRSLRFPNVSYGEDYAVALAISRFWRVSRIYDPLYLCRRWERNTDASLSTEQENAHHFYKDKIRTFEIRARKQLMSLMMCLFCLFSFVKVQGQVRYEKEDSLMLERFFSYAAKEKIQHQETGKSILSIASFFTGVPYAAQTIENPAKEILIVNLRQLDCTTLVENTLALYYTLKSGELSFHSFVRFLRETRYRNGEVKGYPSRFHYTTDFLSSHAAEGRLKDCSREAGGISLPLDLFFMSKNAALYPALKNDSSRIDSIRVIEQKINQRSFFYIPKERVETACAMIRDGDLLAMTTSVAGLDVSHIGIACVKEGSVHLMHASSQHHQVEVHDLPLPEYLKGIKSNTGILIYRVLP